MIKWKSFGIFILVLLVFFGIIAGAAWYGYNFAMAKIIQKFPEAKIVPSQQTQMYSIDDKDLKNFVELKKSGYYVMLPKGSKLVEKKDDPRLNIEGPGNKWEIVFDEKLLRYEPTLKSARIFNNPDGDYYILIKQALATTGNPILLFQKMEYLPSNTVSVSEIKTPNMFGFCIDAKDENTKIKIYRLFDDTYWHNIEFYIKSKDVPDKVVQTIVSTITNYDNLDEESETQTGTSSN